MEVLYFNVVTHFLSEKVLRVLTDSLRSDDVREISGVPQGCVLFYLLFLLYTSNQPMILENSLVGFADNSPLKALVPMLGKRVPAVSAANSDLCSCW